MRFVLDITPEEEYTDANQVAELLLNYLCTNLPDGVGVDSVDGLDPLWT